MAASPLPPAWTSRCCTGDSYEEYRVEAPILAWNDKKLIRISIQGYNGPADIDRLLSALKRFALTAGDGFHPVRPGRDACTALSV